MTEEQTAYEAAFPPRVQQANALTGDRRLPTPPQPEPVVEERCPCGRYEQTVMHDDGAPIIMSRYADWSRIPVDASPYLRSVVEQIHRDTHDALEAAPVETVTDESTADERCECGHPQEPYGVKPVERGHSAHGGYPCWGHTPEGAACVCREFKPVVLPVQEGGGWTAVEDGEERWATARRIASDDHPKDCSCVRDHLENAFLLGLTEGEERENRRLQASLIEAQEERDRYQTALEFIAALSPSTEATPSEEEREPYCGVCDADGHSPSDCQPYPSEEK